MHKNPAPRVVNLLNLSVYTVSENDESKSDILNISIINDRYMLGFNVYDKDGNHVQKNISIGSTDLHKFFYRCGRAKNNTVKKLIKKKFDRKNTTLTISYNLVFTKSSEGLCSLYLECKDFPACPTVFDDSILYNTGSTSSEVFTMWNFTVLRIGDSVIKDYYTMYQKAPQTQYVNVMPKDIKTVDSEGKEIKDEEQ